MFACANVFFVRAIVSPWFFLAKEFGSAAFYLANVFIRGKRNQTTHIEQQANHCFNMTILVKQLKLYFCCRVL